MPKRKQKTKKVKPKKVSPSAIAQASPSKASTSISTERDYNEYSDEEGNGEALEYIASTSTSYYPQHVPQRITLGDFLKTKIPYQAAWSALINKKNWIELSTIGLATVANILLSANNPIATIFLAAGAVVAIVANELYSKMSSAAFNPRHWRKQSASILHWMKGNWWLTLGLSVGMFALGVYLFFIFTKDITSESGLFRNIASVALGVATAVPSVSRKFNSAYQKRKPLKVETVVSKLQSTTHVLTRLNVGRDKARIVKTCTSDFLGLQRALWQSKSLVARIELAILDDKITVQELRALLQQILDSQSQGVQLLSENVDEKIQSSLLKKKTDILSIKTILKDLLLELSYPSTVTRTDTRFDVEMPERNETADNNTDEVNTYVNTL